MREFDVLTFDEALAEVIRLGLLPISGGDGEETPPADPPADSPTDPPADPPADPPGDAPDPAAENARLREEVARLQGELAGRQAQPPPKPPEPRRERTLDDMSVEELDRARADIEAKVDGGEITAGRAASVLGDIAAVRREKVREAQRAQAEPIAQAEERLGDLIGKYPDLGRKGSELLGKVAAELPSVCRMTGFAPNDPRAQVIAAERVVGGHRMGGGFDVRRKIPTGGAGAPPAGGDTTPGRKNDPLAEVERLYPDQVAYWDKMHTSAADRAAEAPLVLARRARRQRTA